MGKEHGTFHVWSLPPGELEGKTQKHSKIQADALASRTALDRDWEYQIETKS